MWDDPILRRKIYFIFNSSTVHRNAMKFCFKMRITNIYISWFFHNFFAILTHQEIDWANRPERQIAPLSPIIQIISNSDGGSSYYTVRHVTLFANNLVTCKSFFFYILLERTADDQNRSRPSRNNNIYISWFFHNLLFFLTHQEIDWANRPERQIAPLSPMSIKPID